MATTSGPVRKARAGRPTPTPQSKPVTRASRLVAQDIAPLVAFELGPGILAAGPATYRQYSHHERLCKPRPGLGRTRPHGAQRRAKRKLRLVCPSGLNLGVASWGVARLEERRWRACRCSRGRRPSGSDSEPRDRHATLLQPRPILVDGRSTQTRRRRACRLQRPWSLPDWFVLASITLTADLPQRLVPNYTVRPVRGAPAGHCGEIVGM